MCVLRIYLCQRSDILGLLGFAQLTFSYVCFKYKQETNKICEKDECERKIYQVKASRDYGMTDQ